MKLRTKTVLAFLVATICLVGVIHTTSYTILLNSYGQLEQKEVSQTVERVQGQLLNQYSVLNSKLGDWAVWDDSYRFVHDNNSAFIQSNINPTAFSILGLNYMIFVNSSGRYVFGMGFDLANDTGMRIPNSVLTLVTSNTRIWDFQNLNDSLTGIVLLPEGPLLLASRPILTSQGSGPIRGAVIFARYFDQQFVESLSTTVHLPLNLTLFSSWQESDATSSYSSVIPSIYVHPLNTNQIAGYYVIDDINSQPALVLGTTLPRDTYTQGLTTLSYLDLSVVATSVAFSVVMLLLMERVVLSRLHKLDVDVMSITGQTDFAAKLSISGDDAIASLSGSINKMLEEIENKTIQLRKSERFSAIGELATMVAHDLRNPLQGIANAAFFLKRSPTAGAKEKEMLTLIEDDVKYSDKIVNDLLDYSRNLHLELTETNPQLLMKQTLSLVTIPKNIDVVDKTESEPTFKVDVDKIKRVFINIINNAMDAMPNGGLLVLQAKGSDHEVDFIFVDSGVGMTKEVLERIFTPLYTTKAKGMGFGLSICKRIVEAHRGQISAKSTPGKETVFTISLPVDLDSKGGENS